MNGWLLGILIFFSPIIGLVWIWCIFKILDISFKIYDYLITWYKEYKCWKKK
jgi:hypothetical protein